MSRLDEIEKNIERKEKEKGGKKSNPLLQLIMGFLLLAVGVFIVFQSTAITQSVYVWRIGTFALPSATVIIPLLIGIGVLFFNSKSVAGWIVTGLGVVFVLVTIVLSVRIHFSTTSLFNFILMFGSITGGAGLILKALFSSK